MVILPFNTGALLALNHVHIAKIRMDYFIHFALFLPWACFYSYAFSPAGFFSHLIMIAAGLLMAIAAEGIQHFLVYRSFNIHDMVGNLIGILAGSLLLATPLPGKISQFLHHMRKNNS